MAYIRKIDNPTQIFAEGNFDKNFPVPYGYEIVFDKIPDGLSVMSRPKNLADQLNEVFMAQTAAVRAEFYTLKAAVNIALSHGDIEAAKIIVQNVVVPTELESVKAELLSKFPA